MLPAAAAYARSYYPGSSWAPAKRWLGAMRLRDPVLRPAPEEDNVMFTCTCFVLFSVFFFARKAALAACVVVSLDRSLLLQSGAADRRCRRVKLVVDRSPVGVRCGPTYACWLHVVRR